MICPKVRFDPIRDVPNEIRRLNHTSYAAASGARIGVAFMPKFAAGAPSFFTFEADFDCKIRPMRYPHAKEKIHAARILMVLAAWVEDPEIKAIYRTAMRIALNDHQKEDYTKWTTKKHVPYGA